MNNQITHKDSPAWLFQVWASFIIAAIAMLIGIYYLPVDLWIKGYFVMGTLFLIGSTFSLAKTMRDRYEAEKLANRVASAKTEKILSDYEFRDTLKVN